MSCYLKNETEHIDEHSFKMITELTYVTKSNTSVKNTNSSLIQGENKAQKNCAD